MAEVCDGGERCAGRGLPHRGRERDRAVALAEQARDVFRTGPADDQVIAEIGAFLAIRFR